MKITGEQKSLLKEYGVAIPENVEDMKSADEINEVLLALDAKITEIGFDANYDLNDVGLKLQKLYDQLYDQN